jgi:quercetin dioxygenase-like cupin family protein
LILQASRRFDFGAGLYRFGVADNCETRAQFGITIVFVGVEMGHSSGPEPGREATEATLTRAEQLHWVRHGNEYETAVLSGDPEQPGSFYVMRYRVHIACDVPPHWHPEDEHATVISGEISLGLGEKFLADTLLPLTAGSYALIPRRQPHFTRCTAGSIVQVHGLGGWSTLNADHPSARISRVAYLFAFGF